MTNPASTTEEREQFETWIDSRPGTTLRSSFDGSLDYPLGNIVWETWQAARRTAPDVRAMALEEAAKVCIEMADRWAKRAQDTNNPRYDFMAEAADHCAVSLLLIAEKKDET